MAWAATIVQKGIVDKSFQVAVSYSNGTIQFVETMDMTGGTLQGLSDRVAARLAGLETTVTLIPQVTLGAFVPTPAVTPANTNFLATVKHFQSCQRAVSLGVLASTDPLFVNAQSAMIAAYDPAFIDSL